MNCNVLRRAECIIVCIDIVLMLAMALSIFLIVSPWNCVFDTSVTMLFVLFLVVGPLSAAAVFLQGMRISISRGDTILGRWHVCALAIYAVYVVIVGGCSAICDGLSGGLVTYVALSFCGVGYFYAGIMALINTSLVPETKGD